jgi:hypothetical protein
LRIERVANPDDHFGFGGKRKNFGVEDFRATGGEGMGFVVAELVEKPGLGGFMGTRGVDAIDIGPNDELIGVYDVGNDGTGKIGAVAAERGDAAIGSCANEAGDDRDNAGFEKRKKNGAATPFRLFEMRLGVAESIAGQHEIRGGDRDGGDAGLFESGGEEPGAEAFAKGGQTIEKLGTGGDSAVNRNFMKKVAAQELQLATHTEVRVLRGRPDCIGVNGAANILGEMEIAKHSKVKVQKEFGFAASVREFAVGESVSDGKKMIGDALHGGDDYCDAGNFRGVANEARSVEHAIGAEQRAAAELEGDDMAGLLIFPADAMRDFLVSGPGTADS